MPIIRRVTDKLFEGFFVFSIPPAGKLIPKLIFQYPAKFDEDLEKQLPKFCFPYHQKSDVALKQQVFTFSFTDIAGCTEYGFCYQNEPETPASSAICLCVVTYMPWFVFFNDILRAANSYKGDQQALWAHLFSQLSLQEFPKNWMTNGEEIIVHPLHDERKIVLKCPISRSVDTLETAPHVAELCNAFSSTNLLKLFASIISERRILITSSNLGLVTSCVHAANLLMQPLAWEHVFIPIMPDHLLDYFTAPFPYLIGVHSSLVAVISTMPMEDYVFVNADEGTVKTPFSDLDEMPTNLVVKLKSGIKKHKADGAVPATFLEFFCSVFGTYHDHFKQTSMDGTIEFDTDEFINSKPKGTMTSFTRKFAETQPFQQFIEGRLAIYNSKQLPQDMFERFLDGHLYKAGKTKKKVLKVGLQKMKVQAYKMKKRYQDYTYDADSQSLELTVPDRRFSTQSAFNTPTSVDVSPQMDRRHTISTTEEPPTPIPPPRRKHLAKKATQG